MKFHGDEVTDFYDKEIPKVDTNQTCLYFLALISLDHQERWQLLATSVFKRVK